MKTKSFLLVHGDLEAGARDQNRAAEFPNAVHRLRKSHQHHPYVELTMQLSIRLNTTALT